ncbi:MAG: lipid-A-disaccharide synthase [Bdellovibrionales bacterium]|nr:lipid-A-disaccharide synthase [Bdellovibrionales bacterium]
MKSKILIVAAEASSALYAQRLLEHWQQQGKEIEAFGVGTQTLENLGFERLGKSEEMAVVGIQEVVSHWSIIKGSFDRLVEAARQRRPQVALLLDYPDFNLRLAEKLKKINIPVVYYISPQVWAWRQGRVKQIKRFVDKMLVLFPFEKEFYDKHEVPCRFVGHPLLDELETRLFDRTELDRERLRFGVGPQDILLGLMPGSRRSEIRHHLRTQIQTAEILIEEFSRLKVALLVAPTLKIEEIKSELGELKIPLMTIQMPPLEMVKMMDVVLAASGTATLLVGLLEKPMNIMYRMNGMTAYLARRFVRNTPFFGMINLILGKEVCPEFFQERALPEILAQSLGPLVESSEERESMAKELRKTKELLGARGATSRVAEEIEVYFDGNRGH